jgi:hypothetical protein
MLVKSVLAGAASHEVEILVSPTERSQDVSGIVGNEQFLARLKE